MRREFNPGEPGSTKKMKIEGASSCLSSTLLATCVSQLVHVVSMFFLFLFARQSASEGEERSRPGIDCSIVQDV